MKKLLFILLVYVLFSCWISYKIIKSDFFGTKQKVVNIICTWLVPFVWGLLIRDIIKPKDRTLITKNNRKFNKGNFKDNWKSTTGWGLGGDQ